MHPQSKRSNSERLSDKRDSFRTEIRSKQHQAMLLQKRQLIESSHQKYRKGPIDQTTVEKLVNGTLEPSQFVSMIAVDCSKQLTRKPVYFYFTINVVSKLSEFLVRLGQPSTLQDWQPTKRNVLMILTNYFLDYPKAALCEPLAIQLVRLFECQKDPELRSIAITCLGNMSATNNLVKRFVFGETRIIALLKDYKYSLEDSEDIFYLLLMLTLKLEPEYMPWLVQLLPMFKQLFFGDADLKTQQCILQVLCRLAEIKVPSMFELFAKASEEFFTNLYYSFRRKGSLSTELTIPVVEFTCECFRGVEKYYDALANKYAIGLITELLLKPEQEDLADIYIKLFKSLISIVRLRSELVLEDQPLLHILNAALEEECLLAHTNGCPLVVPEASHFDFIYLLAELAPLQKRGHINWPLLCRQIIRCLQEEQPANILELVKQLDNIFAERRDLLSEFSQKGGMWEISKLSRDETQKVDTQAISLDMLLKYDPRPDLLMDQ